MNTLKDYDVLRLIGHNRICYVSSDNVKGCLLIQWLKYHPYISKERLIRWICEMIKQLDQIHKCRGNSCYRYVNPYSIVVTEDEKICFLDIGADSNRERVRIMQRGHVREYFFPDENAGRINGEQLDIYGFGKTVQYLLASVEVEPGFTRKEEKILRKIITRCTSVNERKKFERISEVYRYLVELSVK